MATVLAQWNTTGGDWFNGANWNEPNPSAPPDIIHYVPGGDNDVQVSGGATSSTAFTIAYAGTDTVNTLNSNNAVTLSLASGALEVLRDSHFNGIAVASFSQLTLDATQTFDTGEIAGTVSGAGTLRFVNGRFDIVAGAVIDVANWLLDYQVGSGTSSGTFLNANFSYAHTLQLTSPFGNPAYLHLDGYTLTLSGTATINGAVDGPGTLLLTGTASVGGAQVGFDPATAFAAANAATIENAASVTQTGNVSLNGAILNDAGAGWTIATASSVFNDGGTFTNNGTLTDAATNGNAEIDGTFASTGTLSVASGAELVLSAGAETVGGTVGGAGTLAFGYAHNATLAPASLTVATVTINGGNGGGIVSLGETLSYGGTFNFTDQFGYLALAGHTLTVSGASSFIGSGVSGPGRVLVTGSSTVGFVTLGNSPVTNTAPANALTFENAGTVSQIGYVNLNGTILNDTGATYAFGTAASISSAGATFTNNGTLTDTATNGSAEIDGTFSTTGVVSVAGGATFNLAAGMQTIGGAVSGAGVLNFGYAHNATLAPASLTVATVTINGGNGGGIVSLGETLSYGGTFNFTDQFGYLALAGHTLTVSGASSFIGSGVSGPGRVLVTGSSTVGFVTLGNSPVTNTAPANALTFENAGTVSQIGYLTLNGSILNDAGATYAFGTTASISNAGGTFVNAGTLTDSATNGAVDIDAALTNTGLVQAGAGTLQLRGAVTNDGTLAAAGGNLQVFAAVSAGTGLSGTTTIGSGASAEFSNAVAANQTVRFAANTGRLQLDDPSAFAGTVAGFQIGDVTEIGISHTAGDQANLLAGNVLQVSSAANAPLATLQLDPAANYAGLFFHLAADTATGGSDITLSTVACYCAGTLIQTADGEVPVERLAIGDTVVTASGDHRPIRWIGQRRYSGRFLAGRRGLLPVRFRAGSLGGGLPKRDLFVSPKHAMFLGGVLIPAHALVNGSTIEQVRRAETVSYFHVELETHDILLAEGAAAESFLDDDSRAMFHNAADYAARYGTAAAGDQRYCAPRQEDGFGVERVRSQLAAWAAAA